MAISVASNNILYLLKYLLPHWRIIVQDKVLDCFQLLHVKEIIIIIIILIHFLQEGSGSHTGYVACQRSCIQSDKTVTSHHEIFK